MPIESTVKQPFQMYVALLAQPEAFAQVAQRHRELVDRCAAQLASCERLFLVGIGTSHHAAQVGEHLVRLYGGGLFANAVHAFDFAVYGPHLTSNDAVIGVSHRGNKHYTLEALKRACSAGCYTTLITGENASITKIEIDTILQTIPQETSSAHTVSYTSAIAVLSVLVNRIGYHRIGINPLLTHFLHSELPERLLATLQVEPEMMRLAHEYNQRRRIWLVGAGPDAITAQEVALKIKETSYLQAEGMSVETMLHGPFQCAEADDLFVLIAPSGRAMKRVLQLGEMVHAIGAACLVVSDRLLSLLPASPTHWLGVPTVPEPFSVLTCLIPLQLFAYYLSLECGTNPDSFRLEDPRFAQARALVQL